MLHVPLCPLKATKIRNDLQHLVAVWAQLWNASGTLPLASGTLGERDQVALWRATPGATSKAPQSIRASPCHYCQRGTLRVPLVRPRRQRLRPDPAAASNAGMTATPCTSLLCACGD